MVIRAVAKEFDSARLRAAGEHTVLNYVYMPHKFCVVREGQDLLFRFFRFRGTFAK